MPKGKYKDPEYLKKWRKNNRDKIIAANQAWKSQHPQKGREYRLRFNYGISLEEYDAMVAKQEGKCEICKEEAKLVVDHCHSSLKVRGLLCNNCNAGLGLFKDDVKRLIGAHMYLLKENYSGR